MKQQQLFNALTLHPLGAPVADDGIDWNYRMDTVVMDAINQSCDPESDDGRFRLQVLLATYVYSHTSCGLTVDESRELYALINKVKNHINSKLFKNPVGPQNPIVQRLTKIWAG